MYEVVELCQLLHKYFIPGSAFQYSSVLVHETKLFLENRKPANCLVLTSGRGTKVLRCRAAVANAVIC